MTMANGDAPLMAGDFTVSRRIASRPNPLPPKLSLPPAGFQQSKAKTKKIKTKSNSKKDNSAMKEGFGFLCLCCLPNN